MSELESYRSRKPDVERGQVLRTVVWLVTAIVLVLVGLMRRVTLPLPEGVDLGWIPALNATLNSLVAVSLVVALMAVKGGQVRLHQRCVNLAMIMSGLFLLCYVGYHFTTPEVIYGDSNGDGTLDLSEKLAAGGMRTVYLVILLSHIVLAALSLPFILMTYVYGITAQFAKHRRMARRIFPVWLYVAVTGPVCYLFLRPFYG